MATKHCKSSSLPAIIVRDILSRLPVKSLVRFKSVSKSWSSLIKSSAFAAAQLRRSSRRACLLLRHYTEPSSVYGIVLLRDAAFPYPTAVSVPIPAGSCRFPKIVGSCNGLVCLDFSANFPTHLAVWNPATGEYRTLPARPSTVSRRPWRSAIGFGFSPESDDFRVLRVLYFQDRDDELPRSLIEVCSLRNGSWTEIHPADTETDWVIQEPGIAVNAIGALHWIGAGAGDFSSQNRFIASFDLSDLTFRKVELPVLLSSKRTKSCKKVMAFEQTIALAVYPQLPISGNNFELWVMKLDGGGWFNHCTIQPLDRVYVPAGIWRGSDVVIMRVEGRCCAMLSHDPINRKTKDLSFPAVECSVDVFNYTESIVSVHNEVVEENGKA